MVKTARKSRRLPAFPRSSGLMLVAVIIAIILSVVGYDLISNQLHRNQLEETYQRLNLPLPYQLKRSEYVGPTISTNQPLYEYVYAVNGSPEAVLTPLRQSLESQGYIFEANNFKSGYLRGENRPQHTAVILQTDNTETLDPVNQDGRYPDEAKSLLVIIKLTNE